MHSNCIAVLLLRTRAQYHVARICMHTQLSTGCLRLFGAISQREHLIPSKQMPGIPNSVASAQIDTAFLFAELEQGRYDWIDGQATLHSIANKTALVPPALNAQWRAALANNKPRGDKARHVLGALHLLLAGYQQCNSDVQSVASAMRLSASLLSGRAQPAKGVPLRQASLRALSTATMVCQAMMQMLQGRHIDDGEATAEHAGTIAGAANSICLSLVLHAQGEAGIYPPTDVDGRTMWEADVTVRIALLERLIWLHGTAIATARSVGRVNLAWSACERGVLGIQRIAAELHLADVHTALSTKESTAVDDAAAPEDGLHQRLRTLLNSMELLLPLQHPLHWEADGEHFAAWVPTTFYPHTHAVDMRRPFFPAIRPNLSLHDVMQVIVGSLFKQTNGSGNVPSPQSPVSTRTAHPRLRQALACTVEQWKRYLGFVEGRVVNQLHTRTSVLKSSSGPAVVIRRRRAAALLSMYRDADAASVAHGATEVMHALAGRTPADVSAARTLVNTSGTFWTISHAVPTGRHQSMLAHTLRCVGPLHSPETCVPFLKDRVRLLLRMVSAAAAASPNTASLTLARPDVPMVMSVMRECAGIVCNLDQKAMMRLRGYVLQPGPKKEDEAAARLATSALSASVPGDTLVLQLALGMLKNSRRPRSRSDSVRAAAECPSDWQLACASLARRLGITFERGESAAFSHAGLAALSVPEAALLDYACVRGVDTLHGTLLAVHAARLEGAPLTFAAELGFGTDNKSASPTAASAVASTRLLEYFLLLDNISAGRALPDAYVQELRSVLLKWVALLAQSEAYGKGDLQHAPAIDGLSIMQRLHRCSPGGLPQTDIDAGSETQEALLASKKTNETGTWDLQGADSLMDR